MREANVAVFTNRCEGGTNLVAMEAMACGLPTIISKNSGHLDIIDSAHCYPLETQSAVQPIAALFNGFDAPYWGESDVGEVVHQLQVVYDNYSEAKEKGKKAAAFMSNYSWGNQIKKVVDALEAAGFWR